MGAKWKKDRDPGEAISRLEYAKLPSGGFQGWDTESLIEVIHSCIEYPRDGVESQNRAITRSAIFETASKGKLTKPSLIKEVSHTLRKHHSRADKTYVLKQCLSIAPPQQLRSVALPKARIEFLPKKGMKFDGPTKEMNISGHINLPLPKRYSPVLVTVSARSHVEAMDLSRDSLDLLRACWNLSINMNQDWRRSWPGQKPVNRILLGPIGTLHTPDGKLAGGTFTYDFDYRGEADLFDLTKNYESIETYRRKLLKQVQRCPDPEFVQDWLVTYVRCLDETRYESAFFGLWRLLERLSGRTHDSQKVLVRRASYWYEDQEYHRMVLEHLVDRRNEFVHADLDVGDEILVYQLKGYVERLLLFNIYWLQEFKSVETLFEFMDLPTNISTLRKRLELLRKSIRFRSSSS